MAKDDGEKKEGRGGNYTLIHAKLFPNPHISLVIFFPSSFPNSPLGVFFFPLSQFLRFWGGVFFD